jgi:uncharacterized membrane protein YozB (DUF420 family)
MTIADLPHLNAALNLTSAVLLSIAWVHIKRRRIDAHRRMMIAAFVTSAAFLTSYVIYHAHAGSRPFEGSGILRMIYFAILVPHVILAAAVLPMAIITLRLGLRREDRRHRAIARITLPLWLFVSVTGVLVYLMLYGVRSLLLAF